MIKNIKVSEKELNKRLAGAIVGFLKTKPYRFLDNDLTYEECETLDILINKDLLYKVNFINKYNPHRHGKYYLLLKKNGEKVILKQMKVE